MAKEIKLNCGLTTLVDDEDYEFLSQWNWYPNTSGHLLRKITFNTKSWNVILHRLIMGAPDHLVVDHINGNTFDNRKENLRLCTPRENSINRRMNKNNLTGYKGVTTIIGKSKTKFKARIGYEKKHYHLGYFDTPEEAAKAYNEAALKYHGEFARLNEL